ncbi:hypothetical protein GGI12_003291 [Dipsacomyces acuminosporus]|nr:hypothetical protein GGI12_003291 [Dipsacomyces acuminosporus]
MAGLDNAGHQTWDVTHATSTLELITLIRDKTNEIEQASKSPQIQFFSPVLEEKRNDCRELFRRLIVRNPYSSQRKGVVEKLWIHMIYRIIEQYRANIKVYENRLLWPTKKHRNRDGANPHQEEEEEEKDAGNTSSSTATSKQNIDHRRDLARWRGQFKVFLQSMTGFLLAMINELAEEHSLVAIGNLVSLKDFALDYRALSTHAYGFDFVDCLRTELHPELSVAQRAALGIISQILIYLGDLSRYRILYTSRKQPVSAMVRAVSTGIPQQQRGSDGEGRQKGRDSSGSLQSNGASRSASPGYDLWWPAKNFYRGAIKLAPQRGQTQNQLAVIYGYEKNTLDAVFCYYRALTASNRFAASDMNLRNILESAMRAVEGREATEASSSSKHGSATAGANNSTSGYLYADERFYPNFTRMRTLFAAYQPTASELAQGILNIARDGSKGSCEHHAQQLGADTRVACQKLVKLVKAGTLTPHQTIAIQAIHLFELQQLACLGSLERESPVHQPRIARQSALLTMRITESLCYFISKSIADTQKSWRGLKNEVDVLTKPSKRAIQPLIPSLLWIISASVRTIKKKQAPNQPPTPAQHPSSSANPAITTTATAAAVAAAAAATSTDERSVDPDEIISPLKAEIFRVIRECGLLGSIHKLKKTMESVQSSVNKRTGPISPIAWSKALDSMSLVADRMWGEASGRAATDHPRMRIEDESFIGWLMPDGTVWGKVPTIDAKEESSDRDAIGSSGASALAGISDDPEGYRVRWWQLHCLLSIASECIPVLLDMVDREDIRKAGLLKANKAVKRSNPPLAVVNEEETGIDEGDGGMEEGAEADSFDDSDEANGADDTDANQGEEVPSLAQARPDNTGSAAPGAGYTQQPYFVGNTGYPWAGIQSAANAPNQVTPAQRRADPAAFLSFSPISPLQFSAAASAATPTPASRQQAAAGSQSVNPLQ